VRCVGPAFGVSGGPAPGSGPVFGHAGVAGTLIASKAGMDLHSPPIAVTPHYERLGGHAAVVALVDAFYRAMDMRPEAATIRAMHESDLTRTKDVLVKYFSEWMGGPRLFTPERGAPMLRRRHHPFEIDAGARDAWMLCMRQALDQTCPEEGLRRELEAAFFKVADFMRNTDSVSSSPHP
jgi:hemoglobin